MMLDGVRMLVVESWQVLGQMAPYLLFGFLMAGLLSVWISPKWVERHLGGHGPGPVLKAALLGVPLPLCSCSVIPVSASMRRQGASRAATTAFLLATPQTGADCIAAMYAMLGPVFAIFSPIMAFLTGLLGGTLVRFFGERDGGAPDADSTTPRAEKDGLACGPGPQPTGRTLGSGLRYGFTVLPKDIGAALMVGVVIAGAMAAFIPQGSLEPYIGGGILSILLLMAAGIPVYVCATASIPIAAGLIHMGASPGAALAFLISGPATNAATFTTLWKVLGRRPAVLYMATVAISAVGFGLLLNAIVAVTGARVPHLGGHVHGGETAAIRSHVWAIVLLGVLAGSYAVSRRDRGAAVSKKTATGASGDQRVELVVTGMTCDHCATAVRSVLADRPGVSSAEVDVPNGRVVVTGRPLNAESLAEMISSLGYPARVANTP
ncbi:MAG: SO_0444 family Cu/Zn efflux transporter [Phycisphaerae bacterium]|jgi:uncharacterized membrane protein YraQ (UPF0718 family)/copper chaperone CopZ|nr:SO_0444 family Cu/Zn efflux transporter [Phycisphaerae bacterium]